MENNNFKNESKNEKLQKEFDKWLDDYKKGQNSKNEKKNTFDELKALEKAQKKEALKSSKHHYPKVDLDLFNDEYYERRHHLFAFREMGRKCASAAAELLEEAQFDSENFMTDPDTITELDESVKTYLKSKKTGQRFPEKTFGYGLSFKDVDTEYSYCVTTSLRFTGSHDHPYYATAVLHRLNANGEAEVYWHGVWKKDKSDFASINSFYMKLNIDEQMIADYVFKNFRERFSTANAIEFTESMLPVSTLVGKAASYFGRENIEIREFDAGLDDGTFLSVTVPSKNILMVAFEGNEIAMFHYDPSSDNGVTISGAEPLKIFMDFPKSPGKDLDK